MNESVFEQEYKNFVEENSVYPSDVHSSYNEDFESTDDGSFDDDYGGSQHWKSGWYEVSVKLENEITELGKNFYSSVNDNSQYKHFSDTWSNSGILDSRTVAVIGVDWQFEIKFEKGGAGDFTPLVKHLSYSENFNVDYEVTKTDIDVLHYEDIDKFINALEMVNSITGDDFLVSNDDWDEYCEYEWETIIDDEYKGKSHLMKSYKEYVDDL